METTFNRFIRKNLRTLGILEWILIIISGILILIGWNIEWDNGDDAYLTVWFFVYSSLGIFQIIQSFAKCFRKDLPKFTALYFLYLITLPIVIILLNLIGLVYLLFSSYFAAAAHASTKLVMHRRLNEKTISVHTDENHG